ncbi:hypothetical protein BWI92_19685 [Flectobacillus sp. BAB-3569]|nr:hypothetical protein BWI92_19685 [Flectobacillus sp. BAB-3569]
MIQKICFLRYRQLISILQKTGWIYTFLAVCLLSGLFLQLIGISKISPYWILFLPISYFPFHQNRKDKRLLQQIFLEKTWLVFLFEYEMFSIPFVVWNVLWSQNWLYGSLTIGIVALMARLQPNLAINWQGFQLNHPWIPPSQFEWRAHFRRNGWGIYSLYLLTIVIGVWHWAGFIGLGVVTISLAGCYNHCESLLILKLEHSSARRFLKEKILTQYLLFGKFVAPIVFWYIFRFPEHWLAYLILLFFYFLNFVVLILNKYKSYIPNESVTSGNVYVGMILLGMLLPYFFPISIVLFVVFYPKAIKNLQTYFYA